MRQTLISLAVSLMGGPAHADPASVQVTPVIIQIASERGMGSVRVKNQRQAESSFEVELYAWSQQNGQDQLTPAKDVTIAPSIFSMKPKGEQIIRMAFAPRAKKAPQEQSYRLILRELDQPAPANSSQPLGLRVQLQLSMPVFVSPNGAQAALTARADGSNFVLRNEGGAYARILGASFDTGQPAAPLPRYLLTGSGIAGARPEGARTLNVVYVAQNSTEAITRSIPLAATPSSSVR